MCRAYTKKIGQDFLDMQCSGAFVVGGNAYPDADEAAEEEEAGHTLTRKYVLEKDGNNQPQSEIF